MSSDSGQYDGGDGGGGGGRRPWLTYGMLLVFAVSLTYAQYLGRGPSRASDVALDAVVAYFEAHPYLETPPAIESRVRVAIVASLRHQFQSQRDRRGAPPISHALKRRQQEKLDGLVATAAVPMASLPMFRLGLRATEREPATYLTHVFVHAGWLHLLGNGFLLLILGFFLERTWGSALFGPTLLVTTLISAIAFTAGNPELSDPLIGSSGMLAGVLGAFAVRFRSMWNESAYAFLIVTGLGWLSLPVWYGWEWSVARDLTSAAHLAGPSYWSMAGGFIGGVVCAVFVAIAKIEEVIVDPSQDSKRTRVANPELEKALKAHVAGRSKDAFALVSSLLRSDPNNREALLVLSDVAMEIGRPADAARAMLRVIRDEVRSGAAMNAVDHWLELTERGLDADAEPALLIRIALLMREADQPAAALDALKKALAAAEGADTAVVAARVARASRDLDPQIAEDAAWRALGSMDLELEERQSLEALLEQIRPELGAAAERIERRAAQQLATPRQAPVATATEPPPAPPALQWEDPELPDETATAAHGLQDAAAVAAASSAPAQPVPIDPNFVSRQLRAVAALPNELTEVGLVIEVEGGTKTCVSYDRVEAICVVIIERLCARPIILIDLILNWPANAGEPLRVIRMRGDEFDPRRFGDRSQSPLEAMRGFTQLLLKRTGATPLPDLQSARGLPFASFADLPSYQSGVLSIDEANDTNDCRREDPGL